MTRPPTPTPTPGPRLSREGILDAYIRLADAEGPEAVSLRRLGAELGVDATAVYRHFRDKDALLEAVADRLLAELAERHQSSDEWREDVRRLALEARRMYLGHPRLARVIAASPEPAAGNTRLAEVVLADLRRAGLTDLDAALDPERFPSSVAVAEHLFRDDDATFAFGLDLFLDALEARVSRLG